MSSLTLDAELRRGLRRRISEAVRERVPYTGNNDDHPCWARDQGRPPEEGDTRRRGLEALRLRDSGLSWDEVGAALGVRGKTAATYASVARKEHAICETKAPIGP